MKKQIFKNMAMFLSENNKNNDQYKRFCIYCGKKRKENFSDVKPVT